MKKGMTMETVIILIAGALFVGLLLLILILLKSEGFPLLEEIVNNLVDKFKGLI